MAGLGYAENREVSIISEGSRSIFENHHNELHIDVFFDKLDFCHTISWEGRLEVDTPTIPLAEMLLEKMQIVKINEKDVVDTIMLLLEHPLSNNDQEVINMSHIAKLCASDWGLWRTTTMNLDKVSKLAIGYHQLDEQQKSHLVAQVKKAMQYLDAESKSMAWPHPRPSWRPGEMAQRSRRGPLGVSQ